jgi:eukaryotic-like serine/threonine-protein kinase
VIHENRTRLVWIFGPVLSTMFLGAVSNALDVPFIPDRIRNWWQTGIRDRLWNSRVGEWLARRLGAAERSRAVGGGAFRATESALGVAASELFAALPKDYRERFAELPAIVAALEARAAGARAEADVVAALAPSGAVDAELLAARREAAAAQLAQSVAALEGIRLDLLRLHAGASDLAPLTTLMDAARLLSDDVNRLAEAQKEADAAATRGAGAARIATPSGGSGLSGE